MLVCAAEEPETKRAERKMMTMEPKIDQKEERRRPATAPRMSTLEWIWRVRRWRERGRSTLVVEYMTHQGHAHAQTWQPPPVKGETDKAEHVGA